MREGSLLRHADPEFHLPQVIPWSDTLNLIKRKLGLISKPQQQQQQHQQQHHRPSSRGNGNSGRLPNRLLTIFNGCSIPTQIISEMDDPIVKVSYIQTNPKTGQDSVAMLCGQHFIHWIGSQKQCEFMIRKVATSAFESGPPVKHALYDIQRMIYIQQHRIFIGCTSRAQLRILDQSGSLASSAGPMGDGSIENGFPVLCLAFITDRDQLIVGGIGGMKIYRLERRQDFLNNRYVFELQQQHEMKWPSSRWVRSACYWQNCIYLAIDTGVVRLRMVEDSITQDGEFNENIHAFSITDLLVVEQMQAVVSAAKDGQIIVWDHHGRIMARLQGGHTSSVTGLLLIDGRERLNLERDPRLPEDQLPYLVSSSLDGTVRIWNLLNFKCIERITCPEPVLGLSMGPNNRIYQFGRKNFSAIDYTLHYRDFASIRSPPTTGCLSIVYRQGRPNRILTAATDGSIRFISPLTGETLQIGLPAYVNIHISHLVFDEHSEIIYAWAHDGSMIAYNCRANPCIIKDYWNPFRDVSPRAFKANKKTVVDALTYIECISSVNVDYVSELDQSVVINYFCTLLGMRSGWLKLVLADERHFMCDVVQAHADAVDAIYVEPHSKLIFTISTDNFIKVWSLGCHRASKMVAGVRAEFVMTQINMISIAHLELKQPVQHLVCTPDLKSVAFVGGIVTFNQQAVQVNQNYLYICRATGGFDRPASGGNSTLLAAVTFVRSDINHSNDVNQLDYFDPLKIYATASSDKSIKLWNDKGHLIREILFQLPVLSLRFMNAKGDLLVGIAEDLILLLVQDHLPTNLLGQIITMNFANDRLECPRSFDKSVPFWKFFLNYILDKRLRSGRHYKSRDSAANQQQGWNCKKNEDEDLLNALGIGKSKSTAMLEGFLQYQRVPDKEMDQRLSAYRMQQQEYLTFQIAQSFEPTFIHTHAEISGVHWNHFKKNFHLYRQNFPQLDDSNNTNNSADIYEWSNKAMARLFNNIKRFDEVWDAWWEEAHPKEVLKPSNTDLIDGAAAELEILEGQEDGELVDWVNRIQAMNLDDIVEDEEMIGNDVELLANGEKLISRSNNQLANVDRDLARKDARKAAKAAKVVDAPDVLNVDLEKQLKEIDAMQKDSCRGEQISNRPASIKETDDEKRIAEELKAKRIARKLELFEKLKKASVALPNNNEFAMQATQRIAINRRHQLNHESKTVKIEDEIAAPQLAPVDEANEAVLKPKTPIRPFSRGKSPNTSPAAKETPAKKEKASVKFTVLDLDPGVIDLPAPEQCELVFGKTVVPLERCFVDRLVTPPPPPVPASPSGKNSRESNRSGKSSRPQSTRSHKSSFSIPLPLEDKSIVDATILKSQSLSGSRPQSAAMASQAIMSEGSSRSLRGSIRSILQSGISLESQLLIPETEIFKSLSRPQSAGSRTQSADSRPATTSQIEEKPTPTEAEEDPEEFAAQPASTRPKSARFEEQPPQLELTENLEKMMTASWFKRQDPDQTLTVESLAKDLQNTIVQAELSSEQRCEASEALYYIHDTYRQDLEKLAPEIIKTQLKYLTDEDWSVRAQACTAMLGYQADQFPDSSLFDETLKSLIPMLEDPNEVVRSLAYSVLVAYGITSSHQLKDTIKSLGLLDESNPDRSELRSSKSRSGTRSAKVYKLRSTPFEQSDRVYVMQGGKVYTVDPEITPVRTRSASSRGKSAK